MHELLDMSFSGKSNLTEYGGYKISDSSFEGCYCPRQKLVGSWTAFRNIDLSDITNINSSVHTALVEDVTLHNVKRLGSNPLFLWGCVFKHVKVSGRISGIKINRNADIGTLISKTEQAEWDKAFVSFYAGVDWALDISEAKFAGGVTFEAIPGDKILRNPETSALIRREVLSVNPWRHLNYGNSAFNIAISWFLDGSLFNSTVLVARTGSKERSKDIEVLNMLRNEGLAE